MMFYISIIAAYILVGVIATAWSFNAEPEQDGWLWAILLWPFWVFGFMYIMLKGS